VKQTVGLNVLKSTIV